MSLGSCFTKVFVACVQTTLVLARFFVGFDTGKCGKSLVRPRCVLEFGMATTEKLGKAKGFEILIFALEWACANNLNKPVFGRM